ncbi:MAG: VCBS repeat-containing protein [Deltaproteobacteria bacterium]|nr:VCBS repeat-containing protein [Deltaproteobacteria bacterium]
MKLKLKLMSVCVALALFGTGCGGESPSKKPEEASTQKEAATTQTSAENTSAKPDVPSSALISEFVGKPGRTLLVTQSNFAQNDEGKFVVPDSGELIMLQPAAGDWKAEHIRDTESNVFHKALQYGGEGIFTIGANEAMLKQWQKKDGKWGADTKWHPTFGGKHNRLRDFEMADFDKDGKNDFAIATHDQGVVAVAFNRGEKWDVQELDRKANTFVHEIEIGDLDKDGNLEVYATPSMPNTASGVDQGGGVVRYEWNGKSFDKSEVVHYQTRHIKEVLVADVDGDGTQELYAALEAEMGENYSIRTPVEIMRYDMKDGKFVSKKVISINDRFCRFLTAGDVDGDGKNELIAAAFAAGVWVMEYSGGEYKGECIDKASGGFEHAAYLADMNGDNKLELYVADDNGGVLRQYIYKDGKYDSRVIFKRPNPKSAMVWNITVADL